MVEVTKLRQDKDLRAEAQWCPFGDALDGEEGAAFLLARWNNRQFVEELNRLNRRLNDTFMTETEREKALRENEREVASHLICLDLRGFAEEGQQVTYTRDKVLAWMQKYPEIENTIKGGAIVMNQRRVDSIKTTSGNSASS